MSTLAEHTPDTVPTDSDVLRALVVDRHEAVADGVVLLTLRSADGTELPRWEPGAHIDLLLGPERITRQYSLCGDPHNRDEWQVGVLREPASRGGSSYVHEQLHQGDEVMARGPRNNFPLVEADEYLFIGGGIGITPLIPMVAEAEAAGRPYRLVYGGRTRSTMSFADELVAVHGERVVLHPQDEVGLPDLTALLGTPQPGTVIYCCGPGPLLDAVEAASAHWPPRSLHVERFTPKDAGSPVLSTSFEVELAQSGKTLTVPPDRSILDVVLESGVHVLSSCSEGTCGTCETDVLEGEIDHRDSVLSPDERAANDTMMICVSRAACPRLVLDL